MRKVRGGWARGAVSERVRVTLCGAAGVATGALVGTGTPWQMAVLTGWVAGTIVCLVWIWSDVAGLDAEETRRVSTREDDSRTAARVVVVAASVASLAAVVFGLHRAASATGVLRAGLTGASLATVVLSWLVVHTLFTLRYAHLYYGGDRAGGIELPGGAAPTYRDLAYVAFTVGMTFQVSDTAITDPLVRATVLRHALLSYLFGAAIIAATISALVGLIS